MTTPNSSITTAALAAATVILGIPIAIAAIFLKGTYIPNVILGKKKIDAGPSGSKTLTFGLLTSEDDAVLAAAYISIIASVLIAISLICLRHFSLGKFSKALGWMLIGNAIVNVLAQLGCLLAWIVLHGKDNARTASDGETTYADGEYNTNGRMFTREAWACAMDKYFKDREGAWAGKACSNLKAARFLTIDMVIFAVVLLGIAYWQIRKQDGIGWPFARRQHRGAFEGLRKVEDSDLHA